MLDDLGKWTFRCENCEQDYKAWPEQNAWCTRCCAPHSLCGACRNLHMVTAAEEVEYLGKLEKSGTGG